MIILFISTHVIMGWGLWLEEMFLEISNEWKECIDWVDAHLSWLFPATSLSYVVVYWFIW